MEVTIGRKWKRLIIRNLRRDLAGVSQTVLTDCLRSLEKGGIVTRTACPEVPPRVPNATTYKRARPPGALFVPHHGYIRLPCKKAMETRQDAEMPRPPPQKLEQPRNKCYICK